MEENQSQNIFGYVAALEINNFDTPINQTIID